MRASRPPGPVVALAAVALALSACGGDAGIGSVTSDAGGSGDGLSGEIVISGSSTVEPISALVAEDFQAANPGVSISVDGPGTGDGFELFCQGRTDISDASRPIEPEEIEACEQGGVEFIELKIAFDGMTVMTNPGNDAVSCLDFLDLYALLGPESEGFERWSDADSLGREIGAPGVPYPDLPLEVVAPGQESGTYDSFAEIVMEDFAVEERGVSEDGPFIRPDYQSSANDNVIIQGISGSEGSLGWVGFAYAEGAGGSIKEVEVSHRAEGVDCIAPSEETIADGSYPLSRALYIYVNAERAGSDRALAAFVDHYLGDGYGAVSDAGYVPLPEDQLEQTRSRWEQQETGSAQT